MARSPPACEYDAHRPALPLSPTAPGLGWLVAALNGGGWEGKIRAVRINDASTPWAYRDVIEVVEGAGPNLDVIILPKASEPAQVSWLDLLLSQVEQAAGLERGRIGVEAQIEDAAAWRT